MHIDSHQRRRLPWPLWLAVFVMWTFMLIAPGNWFPGPVVSSKVGGIGVGKLLHVGAFAVLAGSTGWLRQTRKLRTLIAFALILHGGLTELIQTRVPYREGSWRDVGIDTLGVVLGYLTSRWWWPV